MERSEIRSSIYDVITGNSGIEETILRDWMENLDLIPADMNLAACDAELADVENKNLILRGALRPLREKYEYLLIDCPPSLGTITVNALSAADTVLIPIQCEYYALEGLRQVLSSIEIVQEALNPSLLIEGIVFTMYDGRIRLSQEVVKTVRKNFRGNIFQSMIPRNVRLAEAPSHGLPITAYDSASSGAESYRKLAVEVMNREE